MSKFDVRRAYESGAFVAERVTTAGFRVLQIISEDESRVKEALRLLGLQQFTSDIRPIANRGTHGVAIVIESPHGDTMRVRWDSRLMGNLIPRAK